MLGVYMPILVCKKVMFCSQVDESAFFYFIREIKAVKKFTGVGDEIHLHVSSRLSKESIRELLSLFYRYKIDMRQFQQFETAQNSDWFRNDMKYWHKKVFSAKKSA